METTDKQISKKGIFVSPIIAHVNQIKTFFLIVFLTPVDLMISINTLCLSLCLYLLQSGLYFSYSSLTLFVLGGRGGGCAEFVHSLVFLVLFLNGSFF